MKFINWIKSLFAPKPLEPVQDGWKEMAKRVSKKREVEKLVTKVRRNIPPSPSVWADVLPKPSRPAPPMPPVKPAQHPLKPYEARASKEESNLDIMPYAYAYAATHHYDDTPVRSSSDDDTRSSDSFSSGGGGSFDGGGSSSGGSDW